MRSYNRYDQLSVAESRRKELEYRPKSGFNKETEKLLQTNSGKYLFFIILVLIIAICVLIIALQEKQKEDDADKYRNIALIVSYAVIGITLGRACYKYVEPNRAETGGAVSFYLIFWPFYFIRAVFKFIANNNGNDLSDLVKEFIGWSKLPPYPTGIDFNLNIIKVILRVIIITALSLIIYYMFEAGKETPENTVQHKDIMVLMVVLVITSFVLFTPDAILDSPNWQYRAAIFFNAFFFLYSLYIYMLGSYKNYSSDRKRAMFIAAISSGVLLLALCIYYFLYKLPDDEKTKMLRGIFTEEQMYQIDANLTNVIKVLEEVSNNNSYFNDNDIFDPQDKQQKYIESKLNSSVIRFLNGSSKDNIKNYIKELKSKFTNIYRAKQVYSYAVEKYINKKDATYMQDFINSKEFQLLLQDDITKEKADKLKYNIIETSQKGQLPDTDTYSALFGVNAIINTNEVTVPEGMSEDFVSTSTDVEKYLISSTNRAILKELIDKYNQFVGTPPGDGSDPSVGVHNDAWTALDEINVDEIINDEANTDGKDFKNKLRDIYNNVSEYSRNVPKANSKLGIILNQNMPAKKADKPDKFKQLFNYIYDNSSADNDDYLKQVLGSNYIPPPKDLETIKEELANKSISNAESAFNDYDIRGEIQRLSENRCKNAKNALNQNSKYFYALSELIKEYTKGAAADNTSAPDLLKNRKIQEDFKVLNKGIGELRYFPQNGGEDIINSAKIETESRRNQIQKVYDDRLENSRSKARTREMVEAGERETANKGQEKDKVISKLIDNLQKAYDEQLKGRLTEQTKTELKIPLYVNDVKDLGSIDYIKQLIDNANKELNKNKDKNPQKVVNDYLYREFSESGKDALNRSVESDPLSEYRKEREENYKKFQISEEQNKNNQRINDENIKKGYQGPPIIEGGNSVRIIQGYKDNRNPGVSYYRLVDGDIAFYDVNKNLLVKEKEIKFGDGSTVTLNDLLTYPRIFTPFKENSGNRKRSGGGGRNP